MYNPLPPFSAHLRARRARTRAKRATSGEAPRNQYLKLHTRHTKCTRLDRQVPMTRQTIKLGTRRTKYASHKTAKMHQNGLVQRVIPPLVHYFSGCYELTHLKNMSLPHVSNQNSSDFSKRASCSCPLTPKFHWLQP